MATFQDIAELIAFIFVGIFIFLIIQEFGSIVIDTIASNLLGTIAVVAIAVFLFFATQDD